MTLGLRALTGVAGGLAILAGVVIAVEPGFLADIAVIAAVRESVGALEPTLLMLLAGVVLVVGSLVTVRRGNSEPTPAGPLGGEGEGAVAGAGADHAVVGAGFDGYLEAAVDGDAAALATVQDRLRRQAALATGADRDEEPGAVLGGQWTNDRLAAAFLGDETGPSPPIGARLRWVLDPVGERRRRVERSIAAIEAAREAKQ